MIDEFKAFSWLPHNEKKAIDEILERNVKRDEIKCCGKDELEKLHQVLKKMMLAECRSHDGYRD